jgi:methyl-accepting chemotaxis protein
MQALISRLNRSSVVTIVLAFVVVAAAAAGLLIDALPRTTLFGVAGVLSIVLAAWVFMSRNRLIAAARSDVEERSAAEKEWANKAHWYEQLLDLVQMPITVTDRDMNWTFINAAVEKLLGKSRKEIAGSPCSQWGAGICNTPNCGIQRLRKGFNQTIFTQWGMDFLVDTTHLYDLEGNIIGQVEIVTDISTKVQVRGHVREAIESIVTSSTQIERSTESLATGASSQASSLEEIASSMENINEQTKLNVQSAVKARDIAAQSMRQAEEGNEGMAKVVVAMREINKSSENIRDIVHTIQEIADQTNMLSLNAAIEAARAGEAGRGFAVVADEVGSLANKSLDSVKKTTEIVESITKSIAAASGMLDTTAHQLDQILAGTRTVTEISNHTAELNEEQAAAIEQVRQSLDHINGITQSTATNSEETSATISALSQQIGDLSTVVDHMKLDNDDKQNEKLETLLAEVKRADQMKAKAVSVASRS